MPAKVIPISVPPGRNPRSSDRGHAPESPHPEGVSFPSGRVIDRFDDARLRLAAYLDGLHYIGIAGQAEEIKPETVLMFAGLAEDCLAEMSGVFGEIIGRDLEVHDE